VSADHAYRVTRSLASGLVASGVEVVAVCAGSRSTSLALAMHDEPALMVYTFVDERSAAFFALGAARATGAPAAVVTTSGTAVANLVPAAVEARAAGVPLLLLTADRPPELHDVGAAQTIDQTTLVTSALWFADVHTYDESALDAAAHIGAQACASAVGPPAGPVHINLRYREPLTPGKGVRSETPPAVRVPSRARPRVEADQEQIIRVAASLRETPRGIIHVGHLEPPVEGVAGAVTWLSETTGYPVIAEATSRLRGRLEGAHLVDASEALVRARSFAETHRPEVVVRIGATPLTRALFEWVDGSGARQVVIDPGVRWPDRERQADEVLAADAARGCIALANALAQEGAEPDTAWADGWTEASVSARGALDRFLDDGPFFEGSIARAVAEAVPAGGFLVSATSLPIRALDAFASSEHPLMALAHRGASGIDGTLSAALGAAAATESPVLCLTGDLAFLHDVGGLAAATRHRIPLITVVVDNGGGRIFEFLPQGAGVERETFDDLFAVSHTFDLMRAAELFGLQFASVHDEGSLVKTLSWALQHGEPWVIRAEVDPQVSLEAHAAAWAAAAEAL
jgi:2-succinyl-5-enolpyruvyl-6-hydroxy-3-cyclohexene-1-carboxylate synthase